MIKFDCDALRGTWVYLLPLQEEDRESIRPLAKDALIWEFTMTLMINEHFDEQFDRYFDEAINLERIGGQAFVIRSAANNVIIGMTRVYFIEPKDRRLEIGHTWYIPAVWGQVYNKECKLLLLQYIFETLHFNRVEFRVAHQNIRSQRAVEKIGGVKEGVLRKYTYRNDGTIRHTVLFSIIDDEWPDKKAHLLKLIGASAPGFSSPASESFPHLPIGLLIVTQHKYMLTEFLKSPLLIKFDGPPVVFPYAQPDPVIGPLAAQCKTIIHKGFPHPFPDHVLPGIDTGYLDGPRAAQLQGIAVFTHIGITRPFSA
jgi:RimJ/RimL family protein N-acetyltransferase